MSEHKGNSNMEKPWGGNLALHSTTVSKERSWLVEPQLALAQGGGGNLPSPWEDSGAPAPAGDCLDGLPASGSSTLGQVESSATLQLSHFRLQVMEGIAVCPGRVFPLTAATSMTPSPQPPPRLHQDKHKRQPILKTLGVSSKHSDSVG